MTIRKIKELENNSKTDKKTKFIVMQRVQIQKILAGKYIFPSSHCAACFFYHEVVIGAREIRDPATRSSTINRSWVSDLMSSNNNFVVEDTIGAVSSSQDLFSGCKKWKKNDNNKDRGMNELENAL